MIRIRRGEEMQLTDCDRLTKTLVKISVSLLVKNFLSTIVPITVIHPSLLRNIQRLWIHELHNFHLVHCPVKLQRKLLKN